MQLQVFAAMERAKGHLKFLDWGVANATLEEVSALDSPLCCLPKSMRYSTYTSLCATPRDRVHDTSLQHVVTTGAFAV